MENENNSAGAPAKKVKAKFGAKPFAFISGILDILVAIAIIGMGIMLIMEIVRSASTGNAELDKLINLLISPVLIVTGTLFAPSGFLFLAMGIMTIVSSFKSDKKNLNGMLVAVMVFDVLSLIPAIIFGIMVPGVFTIGLIVALVLGFNFKLVDIILIKIRLKKYNAQKLEENKQTYTGPDFSKLGGANNGNNSSSKDATPQESEGEKSQGESQKSGGVDFSVLGKK